MFVERIFGERYHPIWTMVASCVAMAAGLLLLLLLPFLAVAILVYAGGYGIMWIARGTLPLALFGPDRYATLMGRLAFPVSSCRRWRPSAGALLIEYFGSIATMAVLTGFAIINVALVGLLWKASRSGRT